MAKKYLLRAVKQVVILELTGQERVVEADNEAQLRVEGMKFLHEQFPGELDVELEIKKVGAEVSITDKPDQPDQPGQSAPSGGKKETVYKQYPF